MRVVHSPSPYARQYAHHRRLLGRPHRFFSPAAFQGGSMWFHTTFGCVSVCKMPQKFFLRDFELSCERQPTLEDENICGTTRDAFMLMHICVGWSCKTPLRRFRWCRSCICRKLTLDPDSLIARGQVQGRFKKISSCHVLLEVGLQLLVLLAKS